VQKPEDQPKELRAQGVRWNAAILRKLVKNTTFDHFRSQFKSQTNVEKAAAYARSQKTNRWARRRETVRSVFSVMWTS
jgi:hypothetical protein